MGDGGGYFVCGLGCYIASFIAYFVAIGVGWSLYGNVYESNLILGAAAVISIPLISVFAALCVRDCWGVGEVCFHVTKGILFLAGLFECVGAILFFVVAGTQKNEDSRILAYAVSAGVFGIIAGLCCFCSVASCFYSDSVRESNSRRPEDDYS